jgi:hypothetical protein
LLGVDAADATLLQLPVLSPRCWCCALSLRCSLRCCCCLDKLHVASLFCFVFCRRFVGISAAARRNSAVKSVLALRSAVSRCAAALCHLLVLVPPQLCCCCTAAVVILFLELYST